MYESCEIFKFNWIIRFLCDWFKFKYRGLGLCFKIVSLRVIGEVW